MSTCEEEERMADEHNNQMVVMEKSLLDLVVESWRFSKVFLRVLAKLDAGESTRYLGQYRWYVKRINELLEDAGYRLVNLEGTIYDPGMAITPLNVDEFSPNDKLYVDQMIEPIIMGKEGLVKTGTVILKRVEK